MAEGPKCTEGLLAPHPHSKTTLLIGKRLVAACGGYQSNVPNEDVQGENEANSRRVAAAWNACEGIRTEALENGIVGTAMNSVASAMEITRAESGLVKELAGLLEKAQAGLQWYMEEYPGQVTDADHEMQTEIDAALAKAKPPTTNAAA